MDLEQIKELMAAMVDQGMTKVALTEKSGFVLELERGSAFEAGPYVTSAHTVPPHFAPQLQSHLPQKDGEPKAQDLKEGHEVTSPMVGTFYTAASPEADPFVKVGDTVSEETVICIIEAMKVMNEIKAGKTGIVTEVYIDNAQPVEFGTKLLKLS